MKKGIAYLSIAAAFIAGIVVGVVITVFHEEKGASPPAGMASPSPTNVPSAPIPDLSKQIDALKGILKEDPKNPKALIELGNAYFDTDQAEKAIEAYTKALEIDPNNSNVRTDLGIMYRKKGDFDRAISEFKKAAQADPGHVNSRYNLGIVLLHDKGDLKGAITAWEEYLKVEPAGPRAENIRTQMGKMREMIK
ncbi:MAG: Tetratricopeptide 2 repeat protein [Deltaproteobacteria bacterium]|jgi:cytochrome c-type biogenesis protein CcmH/NrfG|nr:Tetratricopeptide 2 repeat protein [Deltaproteobacteria bacterium]